MILQQMWLTNHRHKPCPETLLRLLGFKRSWSWGRSFRSGLGGTSLRNKLSPVHFTLHHPHLCHGSNNRYSGTPQIGQISARLVRSRLLLHSRLSLLIYRDAFVTTITCSHDLRFPTLTPQPTRRLILHHGEPLLLSQPTKSCNIHSLRLLPRLTPILFHIRLSLAIPIRALQFPKPIRLLRRERQRPRLLFQRELSTRYTQQERTILRRRARRT